MFITIRLKKALFSNQKIVFTVVPEIIVEKKVC